MSQEREFERIKLSEDFPDNSDHWLAMDRVQDGKKVHCIIDKNKLAVGRVVRLAGKFYFYYSTDEIFDEDGGCITYEYFYRIEWLKPITKPESITQGLIEEMAKAYEKEYFIYIGSHFIKPAFIAGCKAIIELNKKA